MTKEAFSKFHLAVRGYPDHKEEKTSYSDTLADEEDLLWDSQDTEDRLIALLQMRHGKELATLMEQRDPNRTWHFPENIHSLEQDFVEYYRSYMMNDDPEILRWLEQELLSTLGELCTYKIYLRIRAHFAYSQREEERITNDGHVSTLVALRKQRESRSALQTSGDILKFYRTIYLNKTRDFFRHAAKSATIFEDVFEDEEQEDPTEYNPAFGIPFDDPFLTGSHNSEDISLMRRILTMYFQELMDYPFDPPKALAVMYARVLFQLEPFADPRGIMRATESEMKKKGWSLDPDSRNFDLHWFRARQNVLSQPAGASPAWAWARMRGMTHRELEADSEASIQRNFDQGLSWGEAMHRNLDRVPEAFAPKCWGELVFTDCFSEKQIRNWADSVHESTLKKTALRMSKDPACCAEAGQLMSAIHPLMAEFSRRMAKKKRKEVGSCTT